jgi:DNA repair protein RadC
MDMEMSKSSLKPVIGVVIRDPEDVYNLFKPMGYFEIEHLFVIYLNADSQIIQFAVPAVGTEYSVPVPIQEILTQAVEYSAKALIIIHNHPSYPEVGLDPSDSDLRVTQN